MSDPIHSPEIVQVTDGGALRDLRRRVRELLGAGELVALPTETVYGIAARADDHSALERLRSAKGRDPELALTWHVTDRDAVDPAALEARLAADVAHEIKAILVVHVDTASSVRNDIPALRAAIDAAGHPALFMVDCIASLGCERFEMDEWGVDVTVTCSQKGLMMPPGLSFVAAGNKALAVHGEAGFRTRYWDWTARHGEQHYEKYCGTPPVHMLFGLRQSLDMLFDEGLEAIFTRHSLLAGAVQAAVTVWAETGALEFNITAPAERAYAASSATGEMPSQENAARPTSSASCTSCSTSSACGSPAPSRPRASAGRSTWCWLPT